MGRDNRDRYGYRHRQDSDYEMGESKPGDVGDSKGTFHDRARKNSNVIVDGKARTMESHQRSSVEATNQSTSSLSNSAHNPTDTISQDEADGEVVTLTVKSDGGTLDTMAEYKNHQVHVEGGTPGEKIRVRLEKGPGYLIGRRISTRE